MDPNSEGFAEHKIALEDDLREFSEEFPGSDIEAVIVDAGPSVTGDGREYRFEIVDTKNPIEVYDRPGDVEVLRMRIDENSGEIVYDNNKDQTIEQTADETMSFQRTVQDPAVPQM